MPPGDKKSFDPSGMLKLPPSLRAQLYAIDQKILRLNQLFAPATDLDALLYPIEYGVRLLAYLSQLSPSRIQLLACISRFLRRTPGPARLTKTLPSSPPPSTPAVLILADTLTSFHTTLRLLGLLPLYTQLRATPSGDVIAIAQVVSLLLFQLLENIAHLIDLGVLSPSSRLNVFRRRWEVNGSGRLWVWSNRSWLAGVGLGVLGLWRRAWLEREGRKRGEGGDGRKASEGVGENEGAEERDRKWWRKLLVEAYWSLAILPGCVEGGITGSDEGVMGFFGLWAGWDDLKGKWDATAQE